MENLSKNDIELTRSVLATAQQLMAADDNDDGDDPKMSEKIRQLKPLLTKLNSKRNKTLKQLGIQQNIKTTTKVEELVDMLISMANQ